MKLSETKSIGKKIILVVFCLILFLIFTALSYGWGPGPNYRLLERPHQELLSPPRGDQFDNVLLVVIPNSNSLSLILCVKNGSLKENPTLQSLTTQEVKSRTTNVKKVR